MRSDITEPTNIGSSELISVDELVETVADVSGKGIAVRHVDGPVGVHARYHSVARIESTGWRAHFDLRRGIEATYPWIAQQAKGRSASKLAD